MKNFHYKISKLLDIFPCWHMFSFSIAIIVPAPMTLCVKIFIHGMYGCVCKSKGMCNLSSFSCFTSDILYWQDFIHIHPILTSDVRLWSIDVLHILSTHLLQSQPSTVDQIITRCETRPGQQVKKGLFQLRLPPASPDSSEYLIHPSTPGQTDQEETGQSPPPLPHPQLP